MRPRGNVYGPIKSDSYITFYSLGFVLEKKHLKSFCVMLGIIHAGTTGEKASYIAYKERSSLVGM